MDEQLHPSLKIDQVVHPLNIAQRSAIKSAARGHWEAVNRTEVWRVEQGSARIL